MPTQARFWHKSSSGPVFFGTLRSEATALRISPEHAEAEMDEHSDWHNAEIADESDDQRLRDFGYRPQFQRVLGLFGDFSLGYSYMSPLAGFYALFTYALTTGGPAFVWTLPVVLFGQVMVALVFAEAASQYPIAGGVYQWRGGWPVRVGGFSPPGSTCSRCWARSRGWPPASHRL